MKLIELPDTLAERIAWLIRPVVQPHHGVDDRNETSGLDLQSEWHTVLAQLADWKSNPNEVADDGVLAPPAALVACAEHVAETLCTNGVQPFRPNRNDESGISVAPAKYTTMQQAALGRAGKQYYVAVLRAGDIRATGMELAARPLSNLSRTISHQRLWRLCLMVMSPEDGSRLGPLAAKQRHAPAWDASPRK